MGAKFFSHSTPGRTRDAGGHAGALQLGWEGRDRQQAVVLGVLRRAAGAPVSFAELRKAGVELPASVVSELELAGVAIERCSGDGRGAVGVRLDPANDPGLRAAPDPSELPVPTGRAHEGPSSSGVSAPGQVVATGAKHEPVRAKTFPINRRSRALAVSALLAGLVVVAADVAIGVSGGDRGTRIPVVKRPHASVVVAAAPHPASPPRPTHPPPLVLVSPALATELEAQGHGLLEDGRYGDAVGVLKRAVLATGETLGACLEPATSACLTYAYALYDLGRATRLNGEPQAAVPILERRLQIDNQRSTVVAELQLARQGIG